MWPSFLQQPDVLLFPMPAQSTSAPCFWAGIPILWKLLPAQPADAKTTSLSQFKSLTETDGKPAPPAESCRETLLGGNAISVPRCAQEREAGTQPGWLRQQQQRGQPGLPPTHGPSAAPRGRCMPGCSSALQQRPDLVPTERGIAPGQGSRCLTGNQLLVQLTPSLTGYKATKNLQNPFQ